MTALPVASQDPGGRWLIAGGALLIAVGVIAGGALWRRRGSTSERAPKEHSDTTLD